MTTNYSYMKVGMTRKKDGLNLNLCISIVEITRAAILR